MKKLTLILASALLVGCNGDPQLIVDQYPPTKVIYEGHEYFVFEGYHQTFVYSHTGTCTNPIHFKTQNN
jgi:hypothetical protein